MGESSRAAAEARASGADRERVAARLREACVDERLSLDTFLGRLDRAYAARTQAELEPLVADLAQPGRLGRAVSTLVARTSLCLHRARAAWRCGRPEPLVLPQRGDALVGRSSRCDIVLPSEFVSRRHAVLRLRDGRWSIDDCGSRNGTWVNGRRVSSPTRVRAGDLVTLGDATYVLVRPPQLR